MQFITKDCEIKSNREPVFWLLFFYKGLATKIEIRYRSGEIEHIFCSFNLGEMHFRLGSSASIIFTPQLSDCFKLGEEIDSSFSIKVHIASK